MSAIERQYALSSSDPSSFSNSHSIHVASFHLNWKVDFDEKKLTGSVKHNLLRSDPSVTQVVFDTRDLIIKSVKLDDGSILCFSLGNSILAFGQPLTIELPNTSWTKISIIIEYETTSKCTALQWLSKEQTAGNKHPYLFSKCSVIHARSLLPCQDTPSVKASYTADVTADSELVALMSAVKPDPLGINLDRDMTQHHFIQKIPIPSYLIAIVVGKLESKRIGPRTCVWSEKELLEKASYEFEDVEKFITTEEDLLGEFVWGVLDILVLPPSFPSGGMENPCLTFVTPTLIAGDKSLANVLVHEVAHSWTGNLVTNKNFEHFWLNEGITVYVERLTLGILYGEPFRQFVAIGGWKELKATIRSLGEENPLTALVPKLTGVDPGNVLNLVPYEKGFLFLYFLEQKVGSRDVFVVFLKHYIWENAYKSIDTEKFREMFIKHFNSIGQGKLVEDIDWDVWLYAPGLPPFEPLYDNLLTSVCTQLKNRWLKWDPSNEPCPFSLSDLDEFSIRSNQLLEFVTQFGEERNHLGIAKIVAMDTTYGLSGVQNSEIKFQWIQLCIREKSIHILPLALQFISEQGRIKFTRAIYKTLFAWNEVKEATVDNFKRNRPNMMLNTANIIAKDLGLEK